MKYFHFSPLVKKQSMALNFSQKLKESRELSNIIQGFFYLSCCLREREDLETFKKISIAGLEPAQTVFKRGQSSPVAL